MNQSENPVVVSGKAFAIGEVILTITTDEEGIAETGGKVLPYGTYEIHEKDPSTGYLVNSNWSQTFDIREDGEVIDLTGEPCEEEVIRGGVAIAKYDRELDTNEALGSATLEEIEFTITNASKASVLVEGKIYEPGEVVAKLYTDEDGNASLSDNALPYGTYTIKETAMNKTYLLTDGEARTFVIRGNGKS